MDIATKLPIDRIAYESDDFARRCRFCNKEVSGECTHFSFGAYQDWDRDEKDLVNPEILSVSCTMSWQPPETPGAGISLVNDIPDEGISMNFCSPNCLRKFLNHCVDELEKEIQAERKEAGLT